MRSLSQLGFLDDVCEAGKANVFHFNTVIGRCTYEESSQLIRRMLQLGVEPDRLTYLRFIQKAVMRGEMDVAEATLVRLEEAKIRPNAEIYTTVIHGYGRIADYKQVCHLLVCTWRAFRPRTFTLTMYANTYPKIYGPAPHAAHP